MLLDEDTPSYSQSYSTYTTGPITVEKTYQSYYTSNTTKETTETTEPPMRQPTLPYWNLVVLTLFSLAIPALILLVLLSGLAGGNSPVPDFYYGKIMLSRMAVEARTNVSELLHPVNQTDANVILLYLDSYCTTQGNPDLFPKLANRTVLDYDVNYSNMTCYSRSLLNGYFDMQHEFGLDDYCAKDDQEHLKKKTSTTVKLYLASLVIYLVLLIYHILLWLPVSVKWAANKYTHWAQFLLMLSALIVNGIAAGQAVTLRRSVLQTLRMCFNRGNFRVKNAGTGLLVVVWVLVGLGVAMILAFWLMMCLTDGRKAVPRPVRPRGYGGSGGGGGHYVGGVFISDGGGYGGYGGGDGGGGCGGGDGGGGGGGGGGGDGGGGGC